MAMGLPYPAVLAADMARPGTVVALLGGRPSAVDLPSSAAVGVGILLQQYLSAAGLPSFATAASSLAARSEGWLSGLAALQVDSKRAGEHLLVADSCWKRPKFVSSSDGAGWDGRLAVLAVVPAVVHRRVAVVLRAQTEEQSRERWCSCAWIQIQNTCATNSWAVKDEVGVSGI